MPFKSQNNFYSTATRAKNNLTIMVTEQENNCRGDEKWEDWDKEESLSFVDLPLTSEPENNIKERNSSQNETFEFESCGNPLLISTRMSSADELFSEGMILPLKRSSCSETFLNYRCVNRDKNKIIYGCEGHHRGHDTHHKSERQNIGRCGSQNTSISDSRSSVSMDRSSSTNGSSCYINLRSNSNGSLSFSSSSVSTNYKSFNPYTLHMYSSPKPYVTRSSRTKQGKFITRSRRSFDEVIVRLSLIKTPEIELQRLRNKKKNDDTKATSNKYIKIENDAQKSKKQRSDMKMLFNGGFSCKRSCDVVDIALSENIVKKNRSKGGLRNKEMQRSRSHSRIFEWLKELSIAEAPEI